MGSSGSKVVRSKGRPGAPPGADAGDVVGAGRAGAVDTGGAVGASGHATAAAPPDDPRDAHREAVRERRKQRELRKLQLPQSKEGPVLNEVSPDSQYVQHPPEKTEEWLALPEGGFERVVPSEQPESGQFSLLLVRSGTLPFGFEVNKRNQVVDVDENSVAFCVGLRAGDLLVGLNGRPLNKPLARVISTLTHSEHGPVMQMELEVFRDSTVEAINSPPALSEQEAMKAETEAGVGTEHGDDETWVTVRLPDGRRWHRQLVVLDEKSLALYSSHRHADAGVPYALLPAPMLQSVSVAGKLLSLRVVGSTEPVQLLAESEADAYQWAALLRHAYTSARQQATDRVLTHERDLAHLRAIEWSRPGPSADPTPKEKAQFRHGAQRVAAAETRLQLAHNLMLGQLSAHSSWWRGEALRKLWAACSSGDRSQVEKLVHMGTAIDAQRPLDDMSPLMLASRGANVGLCDLLLQAGAQVELRCSKGMQALHYACKATYGSWQDAVESGSCNPNEAVRVIRHLVQQGAPLDDVDLEGHAPLDLVRPELLSQVRQGITAFIEPVDESGVHGAHAGTTGVRPTAPPPNSTSPADKDVSNNLNALV